VAAAQKPNRRDRQEQPACGQSGVLDPEIRIVVSRDVIKGSKRQQQHEGNSNRIP
jgi:hypothetical protein